MSYSKISLYLIISCFFMQGCGENRPGGGNPGPTTTPRKLSIVRKTASPGPAFYQYTGLIGSLPQRQFDPTYLPRSRSASRTKSTRESAGGLIYTLSGKTLYTLIGLERQNNFWNFMRGSVDVGESYVHSAANEIHQETGGVYEVTENVLLSESFDVYHSTTARNYACTFFVKFDYAPAQEILEATQQHPDRHFREMTAYAWIRLDDLKTALAANQDRFTAETIQGETLTFNFYSYSFDILRQAFHKGILDHLN